MLSGGESARAALASILLSRFDVLLLDEPTNDLDFDGLDRLERFLEAYAGALVVVSHDRAFLDRTVTRIASIEPETGHVREWAGGFSEYEARRNAERAAAYARFEEAEDRRRNLAELLNRRRTEARAKGDSLGKATGGADRRATHALSTKVRQAERLLGRNELPEKPFEPWELRLSFGRAERPSDRVLTLQGAVAERGSFRLGPLDVDLEPGERLSVTGRNGSGKSTLLGMLLGEVPLAAGTRQVGPRTTVGALGQGREAYGSDASLLDELRARTGLPAEDARTLLAKFGLGADHVGRPCSSLSPGERTRAHLAELQARAVNLLVLDEPTNHLDLEAVEQLETAARDSTRERSSSSPTTAASWRRSRRRGDRAGVVGAGHARPAQACLAGSPPLAILRSRSWPSRSERRRRRGATSAARSMGSRSRASSSARTAGSRSARIACARTARRTRAGTSSRSASRAPSRRPPMAVRVAVDALGGDRRPTRSSRARSRPRRPRSSRSSSGPRGLDTHGLPLVETTRDRSRWTTTRSRPCAAKPDSSLVRAVRAVADGEADAVVSAG